MILEIGFAFAFAAMLCWGVGDFLIQRSTRRMGDWETLFVITAFGALVLLPFVYNDITQLLSLGYGLLVLMVASIALLIAALFDYEALKKGKASVIEPIMTLEIPITGAMAFAVMGEQIGITDALLIAALMAGIFLVSLKKHHLSKTAWMERGVAIAIAGAVFMGLSNFFVGFASRVTNPLIVNWFLNAFLLLAAVLYLAFAKRLRALVADIRRERRLVLATSALDNGAWISFAFAATMIPITFTVAISESYIIITALLGMWLNREVLLRHQKAGLVVGVASAIALAMTMG